MDRTAKRYGCYLLCLVLNVGLSMLLPYLFVLFVADIELIMYVTGTLDPASAAQMRGEGGILPVVILITILFTAAFVTALIFGNRSICRQLGASRLKYTTAASVIFLAALYLDMIIVDPLTIM